MADFYSVETNPNVAGSDIPKNSTVDGVNGGGNLGGATINFTAPASGVAVDSTIRIANLPPRCVVLSIATSGDVASGTLDIGNDAYASRTEAGEITQHNANATSLTTGLAIATSTADIDTLTEGNAFNGTTNIPINATLRGGAMTEGEKIHGFITWISY